MTMRLTVVALLGVTLVSVYGQTPASLPAFEVTSVRPSAKGATRGSLGLPPTGTVHLINADVRMLIVQAYQIDRLRLIAGLDIPLLKEGAPKFDVEAKPPETGLTGSYAWRLAFALNPVGSEHPSIFTAVEQQLGLKLEPMMSREALEVLVVDSVEMPMPN